LDTVYNLFKFLHIVAAIVWIGGVVTVSIINARLVREQDPTVLAAMASQMRFNGMAVLGPAAGLTLITGIVMIAVSDLGVPLWVIWGLAAIIASVALGATLIRRGNEELNEVAAAAKPGDPRLSAVQRRLSTLNTINVLVLLSAVWAMVFRPAL
jgi:uncharacterized membrane protein